MTVLDTSALQSFLWLALFLAALLCWVPITNNRFVHAEGEEEDYACLAGFKNIVEDAQHALVSWKLSSHRSPSSKPPCNGSISWWSGVTCQNNRVFSISLSRAGLGGAVPTSLVRCSALNSLDLSANQLSGEIPPNLGSLANLVSLNLSGNELTGEIPAELSTCSYLNTLDLHENALAGAIPSELGLLERLQVFDVSDNGLSGPIPTVLSYSAGGGPRFNASSFDGNKDLFGFPLSSSESSGHTLSLLEIVGIGLASGVFSLTVSFTAVCIWLKMAEQRRAAEEGKISDLMTEA